MDDVLITGTTDESHLSNIQKVLERIKNAGVHLNKEKREFMKPKVVFCGQEISKEGIKPVSSKEDGIVKAPAPQNVSQLKSYLGILNFYHRFLPNVASVLSPLHKLLQKGISWKWSNKEAQAFQKSKDLLLTADVLEHYDPNKTLTLSCDASSYGIGAVLSQNSGDVEHPVGFVSRFVNTC
jgi:hypothetical protein